MSPQFRLLTTIATRRTLQLNSQLLTSVIRTMASQPTRRLTRPALFICDIQEKFRPAIWEYDKVVTTTQKLLRASTILSIPIFITTQNRTRLGPTCAELSLSPPSPSSPNPNPLVREDIDKTAFSMWTPEIARHFTKEEPSEIAIVGIESHICVTQTTIDALKAGQKVYVITDGVSSCNKEEIPVALERLRAEGAVITSSESFIYECMGDAGIDEFKAIAGLIKEYSGKTKEVVGTLMSKI